MDPDLYIILVAIVTCAIGVPIARAIARRIAGPAQGGAIPRELTQRLQRIEHAVEAMAVEVERIGEGQRFTTQLLAGRAGDSPAQARGGSPPYRPSS